jgi:hypothetical protein
MIILMFLLMFDKSMVVGDSLLVATRAWWPVVLILAGPQYRQVGL